MNYGDDFPTAFAGGRFGFPPPPAVWGSRPAESRSSSHKPASEASAASTSLSSRLLAVAGEFESERRAEQRALEEQVRVLREANAAANATAEKHVSEISQLSAQVDRMALEVAKREAAAARQLTAVNLSLVATRLELLRRCDQLLVIADALRDASLPGGGEQAASHSFLEVLQECTTSNFFGEVNDTLLAAGGISSDTFVELAAEGDAGALHDALHSPSADATLSCAPTTTEALFHACVNGQAGVVKLLLELPQPHAPDLFARRDGDALVPGDMSAFSSASFSSQHGLAATLAVAGGPGLGLLHCCAIGGSEEVLKLVLARLRELEGEEEAAGGRAAGGSNTLLWCINDGDAYMRTPLHVAAAAGRPGVVKLLLLNGADPAALDAGGCTPRMLAQGAAIAGPYDTGELTRGATHPGAVSVLSDTTLLFWNASQRASRAYADRRYVAAIACFSAAIELIEAEGGASGAAGAARPRPIGATPRDRATLYYNRARARYRLGQHCGATADCTAALAADASYKNALAQRGECALALFDAPRAVSDFTALVRGAAPGSQDELSWLRRLADAKQLRDLGPYEILGLPAGPATDAAAIRKAYRALCLRWHPDKHMGAEAAARAHAAFRRISEANDVLCDPVKRMLLDASLATTKRQAPAPTASLQAWLQRELDRDGARMEDSLASSNSAAAAAAAAVAGGGEWRAGMRAQRLAEVQLQQQQQQQYRVAEEEAAAAAAAVLTAAFAPSLTVAGRPPASADGAPDRGRLASASSDGSLHVSDVLFAQVFAAAAAVTEAAGQGVPHPRSGSGVFTDSPLGAVLRPSSASPPMLFSAPSTVSSSPELMLSSEFSSRHQAAAAGSGAAATTLPPAAQVAATVATSTARGGPAERPDATGAQGLNYNAAAAAEDDADNEEGEEEEGELDVGDVAVDEDEEDENGTIGDDDDAELEEGLLGWTTADVEVAPAASWRFLYSQAAATGESFGASQPPAPEPQGVVGRGGAGGVPALEEMGLPHASDSDGADSDVGVEFALT